LAQLINNSAVAREMSIYLFPRQNSISTSFVNYIAVSRWIMVSACGIYWKISWQMRRSCL